MKYADFLSRLLARNHNQNAVPLQRKSVGNTKHLPVKDGKSTS
jgi:hypothetical protein